jgi:RNA polymerase sigma factor FliA
VKARAIEGAYSKVENELRRTPDDAELARELGMSEPDLARALSQISFVGLVALDEILAAGGERPGQTVTGDPAVIVSTTRSRRSRSTR